MQVFMTIRDKHGHSALTQTKISQTLQNRYIETCFFHPLLSKVLFYSAARLEVHSFDLPCCIIQNW